MKRKEDERRRVGCIKLEREGIREIKERIRREIGGRGEKQIRVPGDGEEKRVVGRFWKKKKKVEKKEKKIYVGRKKRKVQRKRKFRDEERDKKDKGNGSEDDKAE